MHRGARWTSDSVADGDRLSPERRPRLLLLCDFRPHEAATVIDHIEAIRAWSRYDVFVLPMFGDLPDELDLDAFDGLVIHYNLVMSVPDYLSPLARWRVSQFRGVKAAFIQDEYRFIDSTVGVMRTLGIHVLFTNVPQDQVEQVYPQSALPQMKRKATVLTGYVPQQLLSLPTVPYEERAIEVGYRGRRVPAWLGKQAQEKAVIADRFRGDAPAYGLSIDISTREEDRLYGQDWIDFVGRSKAMLGVETGASVSDFDGSIEHAVREYVSAHPDAPFEELHQMFLAEVDGRIRLNQISPRCFEAAALGTLMVLYPGEYSGILKPWRHYVPLQKDHSNMAEVVHAIRDRDTWERITKQTRQEVAFNPRYSFQAMVETIDDALDLTITAAGAIHPGAFARIASRSFERMRTTQLHALGLPPAVNRVRMMAGRVVRALRPSQIAYVPAPTRAHEKVHRLRERWRFMRSLTYWALRPHVLPWAILVRHGRGLLIEMSKLGRLQLMGVRAIRGGASSPFAVLIDERAGDLRVVLRHDVPASGSPLPHVPLDLSFATSVSLHLTDPWLAPTGIEGMLGRRLDAVSAVLAKRPDVGRRLLVGQSPWCDAFLVSDSTQ
jgi:hypothetical protein